MVVLLYANLLVNSIETSGKTISRFFEKTTIISFSASTPELRKLEIRESVLDIDPQAKVMEGRSQPISFQSLAAEVYSYVNFISQENYQIFLESQGWEIVEGRLPEQGTNEVVLTEDVVKNRGFKIGQEIGNRVEPTDYLVGSYTLVGILQSEDTNGGLGNFTKNSSEGSDAWFVQLSQETEENKSKLRELNNDHPEILILDEGFYEKRFARSVNQLTSFLWSLNIVVAAAISLSLSLFVYIMYIGRRKEFGAYLALGYTKPWLRRKLAVENLTLTFLAYFLGVALNLGVIFLINTVMIIPKGLEPFPIFGFSLTLNTNSLFLAVLPTSFFLSSYILSHLFINRLELLKIINSQ
jgi:ABC-type antimicrobial peptide transport system permease subunit